jgi:hypothetical protein
MSSDRTTVRQLINVLSTLASELPGGMDTPVEIGVCDGTDLQLLPKVDVDEYHHVSLDGTEIRTFIAIRAHDHPDGSGRGMQARGVAADTDDELRKLTEEPE